MNSAVRLLLHSIAATASLLPQGNLLAERPRFAPAGGLGYLPSLTPNRGCDSEHLPTSEVTVCC
jgi:hypothetical protein